jgi:hypothetical protein
VHVQPRINNPTAVSRREIDAILARGWRPTIQFVDSTASAGLLREVNQLAQHYGDRLEVRFYGHYTEAFDARVLEYLPDVQWLSVDTLTHIRNERRIGDLTKLRKLSFGVFRYDDPTVLDAFPLEQLTELRVGDTHRQNLDLGPLARATQLLDLSISGHTRNIESIAQLPRLESLNLWSTPKRQDLAFLSAAPALTSLRLPLGGRHAIDEFTHPGLAALRIDRVQGLETLGPLARFPCLRSLHVEDQLRLSVLDLTGASLERLVVMNCKTLSSLPGLDAQTRLREFRAARTKLDLDGLLQHAWPPTMQVVGLYSGSAKWNARARAALDAQGYREFDPAVES